MNEARLYIGLAYPNTLKMAKKANKIIPATQITKCGSLLEGQH